MSAHPSAPAGATFHLPARLSVKTPSSYSIDVGTADAVAAWLSGRGYRDQPLRNEYERARLRHPQTGGLAVVYDFTILCQGQQQPVHTALAPLVGAGERRPDELPLFEDDQIRGMLYSSNLQLRHRWEGVNDE